MNEAMIMQVTLQLNLIICVCLHNAPEIKEVGLRLEVSISSRVLVSEFECDARRRPDDDELHAALHLKNRRIFSVQLQTSDRLETHSRSRHVWFFMTVAFLFLLHN